MAENNLYEQSISYCEISLVLCLAWLDQGGNGGRVSFKVQNSEVRVSKLFLI